jgi:hypothetical protein
MALKHQQHEDEHRRSGRRCPAAIGTRSNPFFPVATTQKNAPEGAFARNVKKSGMNGL